VKGFIEHDGRTCLLGEHSNRGPVSGMCPIFAELRRTRIRNSMRWMRVARKTGLRAEAELLRLQAGPERRREQVLARREVFFTAEVNEFEVGEALELLRDLAADNLEPIALYLNSPGGDIFDGLLLFDYVQELREEYGIEFTTRVKGLAASMGSVLAQAGDHRTISANSWYMVHEPSTLTWGKAGDIKREAKLLEDVHKQLCAIIAARSTLSAAEVVRRSTDKDWWVPAPEAVRLGFFDELA
jgi:ATP-dependent Clp endopeptidase proteolytic subunit ClpP